MGALLSCNNQPDADAKTEHPGCCCVNDDSQAGKTEVIKRPLAAQSTRACKLRIIAINDVYLLDNFPCLKTLISKESIGCSNVVTTLAGDFLGPSLLSSLDGGAGMIKVLNQCSLDLVCFGNHEADVPYRSLVQRIGEFKGTWLNSNMPDFEPSLPSSWSKSLIGNDGKPSAREIAFIGLCVGGGRFKATYRDGAFGGAAATMVPVISAAQIAYDEMQQRPFPVHSVIPITHQDMAEDATLAETGLYPVILAGHDHDVMIEKRGECTIIKAGMDAVQAAIVDIEWPDDPCGAPQVTVNLKDTKDYEPDPGLSAMIADINKPVRELEQAMLYELKEDEELSSKKAKYSESSFARLVATAIRESLECDAATINAGAVRGNKEYERGISYGDLKKECPYPSPLVVVSMPFGVLRDAIRWSRKPWWDLAPGAAPQEATSALHLDDGMRLENHTLTHICHNEPEEDRLHTVACDTRVLKKNEVFKKYCADFPERIPPDDAGRPVLPILVDFFCGLMWEKLFVSIAKAIQPVSRKSQKSRGNSISIEAQAHAIFEVLDLDHSGEIDRKELGAAVKSRLGEQLSANVVCEQMISVIDADGDGKISEAELKQAMMSIHHARKLSDD